MPIIKSDRDDFHAQTAEINTTPLVDVMLVLMVIFLITAPVLEKSIVLDLPKEEASSSSDVKFDISISITRDGKYFWNKDEILESEMKSRLLQLKPSYCITIRSDELVPYKDIAHILSLASQSGVKSINFASSDI